MRKLVESTFVTLDGSIGEPQVWGPPYWDDEHFAYASKLIAAADALLLGRVTYEGFAEAWPQRSGDAYALTDATWNASIIEGDAAEGVAALKDQPGGDLLKFGTGELDRALIEHGLVDEFHFWVFPILTGGGQRLIEGIDTTHLELLDTSVFSSGIVVHVMGPK